MRYDAVEIEIGPETLSRIGDDWLRRWQETVDDAQETFTKAATTANPVDAWSLQVEFGMRNAQRWFAWADWETVATEAERASEPEMEPEVAAADAPPPPAPEFSHAADASAPTVAEAKVSPPPMPNEPAETVPEPAAAEAAAEPAADELQRIRGIGPAIEAKLNAGGITSFAQMAALDDEAIVKLDAELDLKGRIERDDWVAQAASLAGKA